MKAYIFAALAMASTPALAAGSLLNATAANQPAQISGVLSPTASNLPAAIGGGPIKSASGSRNGLSWTARSTIIGQTPTSDVLPPTNTIGGGDPIYWPTAQKNGTVALIMDYQGGARFICSGSVIGGGTAIATAAHCVSSGGGVKDADLVKTTAYFYKGDPNERTPFQTGGVEIDIRRVKVNPNYTGEVIDQNDIAILTLAEAAPAWAQVYDLYTSDIDGLDFNVAGYGTRSTVGGAAGNTAPAGARTGFLREGDNKYDYAWGNAAFGGFFDGFFGTADVTFSYVSDFDNGLAANDQSGLIAQAFGSFAFNDTGLGAREVGIAGGDSGGPGFIDGKLASINSYGLTFGTDFGDYGGGLNSGWGEFSGYVPVFIHTNFIDAALAAVPEPSSWAMLIAGFGLVGGTMRRQRKAAATA